jgi:hypothetical protein
MTKSACLLALLAVSSAGFAAEPQVYGAEATQARLKTIVTRSPETIADVVRAYGFAPANSTWSGPDPEDITHGYQRDDLIVTVYLDSGGPDGGQIPCGLHARDGKGMADFVKRHGKWMPDNDLARWMFSKRCP